MQIHQLGPFRRLVENTGQCQVRTLSFFLFILCAFCRVPNHALVIVMEVGWVEVLALGGRVVCHIGTTQVAALSPLTRPMHRDSHMISPIEAVRVEAAWY